MATFQKKSRIQAIINFLKLADTRLVSVQTADCHYFLLLLLLLSLTLIDIAVLHNA